MENQEPIMRTRVLGDTTITISALTFGCGNVGGLMIRGEEREQREAVARALDAGVRYFDTAASYGDGVSEETLGRILPESETRATIGTKVRVPPEAFATGGGVADVVRRSLEDSLHRLRRDAVDLFQLHNPIDDSGGGEALTVAHVVGEVLPVFQDLRRAGKARHIGFTALGDAASIQRLVATGGFETAQVPLNLLEPAAAASNGLLPPPAGVALGTIGIRALAGGALAGRLARHAIAAPNVEPLSWDRRAGKDYVSDVARAARFAGLVEAGAAASLPALAIRYALSTEGLDTFAVGLSSLGQLQEALDAVAAGPLDPGVLDEIARIHSS